MTCDMWLTPEQQCARPARSMFVEWLSRTRYFRCHLHDRENDRRRMREAGFQHVELQREAVA